MHRRDGLLNYLQKMINTKPSKTAAHCFSIRTVRLGIAAALTPLAVVIGITAMNIPLAEAGSVSYTRPGAK